MKCVLYTEPWITESGRMPCWGGRLYNRRFKEKAMAVIHPFKGLRPRPDLVEKVASPPYDVLSSEEARELAGDNPYSFLHVVKAEIDLEPGIDRAL
jgi:hypothetical protein